MYYVAPFEDHFKVMKKGVDFWWGQPFAHYQNREWAQEHAALLNERALKLILEERTF